MRSFASFAFAILASLVAPHALADQVSVAAAANLTYVLKPLDDAFERSEQNVRVRSEVGASGSLVAQIRNGAPYDVFLSADLEYPRKLVDSGSATKDSFIIFACGKLVLWTTRMDLDLISVESVVWSPAVRKIAIANPDTAPYGRAAREALEELGLSKAAGPKLVVGENISQTAQFVSSGNADAGFVALSLVLAPNLVEKGRWIVVPEALYKPLAQGAVLTNRGASNPAAVRYLRFLGSPEARHIFSQFGYKLP